MQPAPKIGLLLVDDHTMFRENLAPALAREPDFTILGHAPSLEGALPILRRGPQVVLLDAEGDAEKALAFMEKLAKSGLASRILIVTGGIRGAEAVQLVRAGVAGIIHKRHSTQELCDAIRKVASGESCVEEEYVAPLFQSLDKTRVKMLPKLTDRERVVLQYVLEGLPNREIGERIHVSEGAVKGSLRQLFNKLGVRTRAQLVKIAIVQYRDQLPNLTPGVGRSR